MVDELVLRTEDITQVPEKYRGAYREDGGAYVLNGVAVGDYEIADTGKLKNALNQERRAKEAAMKQAKAFEKYAEVDLDAAVDALSRIEEFDKGNIDMEAEVQRKLKAQAEQLVAQHNEKLSAATGRSEKLMGKLRKLLVDNQAMKAIEAQKGDVELLLPHVSGRVKVIEKDDDFDIQVLTEQGEPAVDGEAKPITIEALVKGMVKKFPAAFKGAGSAGGGGGGKDNAPGSPQGGVLTITKSEARDVSKYRAARERAAKEGLRLELVEG